MASVWRTLAKQGRYVSLLKTRSHLNETVINHVRLVSTSKNKKDATVSSVEPMQKSEELKRLEEHFGNADPNAEKNWISFGYDLVDKDFDRFAYNFTAFMGITLCLVWGSFVFAYMPDYRLSDWTVREAYLELERREKEGLPLVDPNMVPISKMEQQLPSDEELGDCEVII